MRAKLGLQPAAVLLGVLMAAPVPASSAIMLGGPRAASSAGNADTRVRWVRQCWRHRGHWHCRKPVDRGPYQSGSSHRSKKPAGGGGTHIGGG
jgi:hypothetical protein